MLNPQGQGTPLVTLVKGQCHPLIHYCVYGSLPALQADSESKLLACREEINKYHGQQTL